MTTNHNPGSKPHCYGSRTEIPGSGNKIEGKKGGVKGVHLLAEHGLSLGNLKLLEEVDESDKFRTFTLRLSCSFFFFSIIHRDRWCCVIAECREVEGEDYAMLSCLELLLMKLCQLVVESFEC